MPRSNAEILAEYDKQSVLSKLGTAAVDLAAIAGNGLSGGLANRLAEKVMGAPSGAADEITREQRVRAGLAGDISNVGGMVLGLKGAGGAINSARSIPTAIAATRSAGIGQGLKVLTNTAGPGLVPIAAKGATVSKGALAKGAGILGLLGLSVAGRQEDGTPAAVVPVATPAARTTTPAAAAVSERTITPQDRAMAAIDTILSQPFTMREFETATGALPQVASANAKVSNKDKVFGAASGIADTLYQAQLGQAAKLTGDAKDAAVLQATENYRRNLLETLGVDPSKQALAEAIAAQAGE